MRASGYTTDDFIDEADLVASCRELLSDGKKPTPKSKIAPLIDEARKVLGIRTIRRRFRGTKSPGIKADPGFIPRVGYRPEDAAKMEKWIVENPRQ